MVTLTGVPNVPAGDLTVIDVLETTVTLVPALAPKETVELLVNPVPVMVTVVPAAAVVWAVGLIDVTVGAPYP